jgi:hypothetical protein
LLPQGRAASLSHRRAADATTVKQSVANQRFDGNLTAKVQTVIQVITSGQGSLREKIMTDPRLEKFGLVPIEHQRPGRPHGWAKIHGDKTHGAINLEWHGPSGMLICRVVTKLGNKPNSIIGCFIDYLLARHQSRILSIHIMRR